MESSATVKREVAFKKRGTGERTAWVDVARGIGIVLVVFGHVERGLLAAHFPMSKAWMHADFALYTFHMPLFFLLAGMNVPASVGHGPAAFLRRKLATVAWPYLLWSVIQGLVLVAVARHTNTGGTLGDIARVGWVPTGQFWFLYVLFAFHLATAAWHGRQPGLLVIPAIVAYGASLRFEPGTLLERLLHYLLCFAVGFAGSRWLYTRTATTGVAALLASAFLIAVAIADAESFPSPGAAGALPASVLGIATTIAVSQQFRARARRAAAALGRASFTIFILHVIAAAGTRIGMMRLGVPHDPLLYALICTATGVSLPFACDRTLRRSAVRPWLGFGRPERRRRAVIGGQLAPALKP